MDSNNKKEIKDEKQQQQQETYNNIWSKCGRMKVFCYDVACKYLRNLAQILLIFVNKIKLNMNYVMATILMISLSIMIINDIYVVYNLYFVGISSEMMFLFSRSARRYVIASQQKNQYDLWHRQCMNGSLPTEKINNITTYWDELLTEQNERMIDHFKLVHRYKYRQINNSYHCQYGDYIDYFHQQCQDEKYKLNDEYNKNVTQSKNSKQKYLKQILNDVTCIGYEKMYDQHAEKADDLYFDYSTSRDEVCKQISLIQDKLSLFGYTIFNQLVVYNSFNNLWIFCDDEKSQTPEMIKYVFYSMDYLDHWRYDKDVISEDPQELLNEVARQLPIIDPKFKIFL